MIRKLKRFLERIFFGVYITCDRLNCAYYIPHDVNDISELGRCKLDSILISSMESFTGVPECSDYYDMPKSRL